MITMRMALLSRKYVLSLELEGECLVHKGVSKTKVILWRVRVRVLRVIQVAMINVTKWNTA